MDRVKRIQCLGCGRWLDVESAKGHDCQTANKQKYFVPNITIISSAEITEALISKEPNPTIPHLCPLNKLDYDNFTCPKCQHCESITEIGDWLKPKTWWFCKYPEIARETEKSKSLKNNETDSRYHHLSKATWDCPKCFNCDSVHYDYGMKIFVCKICVARFQLGTFDTTR